MTYIKFYNPYNDAYRDENTPNNVPAANIYETDREYTIEMALPGVEKKDINIHYENGYLRVSVEKGNDNGLKYDRHEFGFSGSERIFKTGDKVNTDQISAQLENGILSLSLPKKEAFIKKPAMSIAVN